MATLVLSAAGAAIGGSIGGTVAGLSTAVVGRAIGATVGKALDQKLLGKGSASVETGRIDRFRLTNASEGEPIAQVFGRMRVGGQVIWASQFKESRATSGGGKGAPSKPKTTSFSYSVSLAVALCSGEISHVNRVWADGEEVSVHDLNMRIYKGAQDQVPDPVIEATEGAGMAPAYRGTAYVVFEDLELEAFGNRVPQFSFEVSRPDQIGTQAGDDPAKDVRAVAMIPGTGEYALATTPVHYLDGPGQRRSANVNSPAGVADFSASLRSFENELPRSEAASLVVCWFGDDLRCSSCLVQPKVENKTSEGENMPWSVAGLDRASAEAVSTQDGRPVYGGTPTDASVIEAIGALHDAGKEVMFYPFILMEQLAGNGLPDPWGATEQAALPWRGRISLDIAPNAPGSVDGTVAAEAQVAAFFGTARASDFAVVGEDVVYTGPQEWSFSRFILHYAALCAAAGGVESFCIGSELRGLTQIRGAGNSFPFVSLLKQLASDVRALMGADVKISYAADWTEYFGYQPQDGTGDRFFHLDPLWGDPNVDFIGIDNYMPLSDWRDGSDHADADAGSIYNLDYLRANVQGGQGYDWYYASEADALAQVRTPITDGAGEAWIWRYKDIRNWWGEPHHERIGGVRQAQATDWTPQSKPIWFTELGCAAIDKATNQPNKFLDGKSSESSLPKYSNGARDDLIQMQYLRAMYSYWENPNENPVSASYGGQMVDMARAFVWAWDTRPFPAFPNNQALWSDGENYRGGHWINGRITSLPLSSVVTEICAESDLQDTETDALHGVVRGYHLNSVSSARSALQPLMMQHGFDAVERNGQLEFIMRRGAATTSLVQDAFVETDELDGLVEHERESDVEVTGRVRVKFAQADGDFETLAEDMVLPDEATHAVSSTELPMALTRGEGRRTAERWLSEARMARDGVRFALPPSKVSIGAGDVINVPSPDGTGLATFRVDRVEHGIHQILEATRIDGAVYELPDTVDETPPVKSFVAPVPVTPIFLDLPIIRGDENPVAPHLAIASDPWPGRVGVFQSAQDANYALNSVFGAGAVVGLTTSDLPRARHGVWDRGAGIEVSLFSGALESVSDSAVLSGANLAAIGDGTPDNWELIQFRDADLVGPSQYRISNLLRGQLGSDALMPDVWAAQSWFVVLDSAVSQIEMPASLRGLEQHFRIGPASRALSHPSYVHVSDAFAGNSLRPYAPAHLKVAASAGGDQTMSWVRRTRVDGDLWGDADVPLNEEQELYRVQIWDAGTLVRQVDVTQASWMYPASLQSHDGVSGSDITVDVAQVSASFGAGLSVRGSVQLM